MKTIDGSKVEAAEKKLAAMEARIAEASSRLESIPAEVEAANAELGKARVEGKPTKTVHQSISYLLNEEHELKAELLELQHVRAEMDQAVKWAKAEAAAEEYAALADELTPRGLRIFEQLQQLHGELTDLNAIHERMNDALKVAGNLAKPVEGEVSISVSRVWNFVDQAIQDTITGNGNDVETNRLRLHGIDISRNRHHEFVWGRPAESQQA